MFDLKFSGNPVTTKLLIYFFSNPPNQPQMSAFTVTLTDYRVLLLQGGQILKQKQNVCWKLIVDLDRCFLLVHLVFLENKMNEFKS